MSSEPPRIAARDIFLARDLSEERASAYLAARGFRQAAEADQHLQQLADDLPSRLALGELAGLLFDTLLEAPDPDAAVVGFCRYVATRVPKSSFLGYLQDDPRTLQTLTRLQGASPFLSEVLVRHPEYLHWLQHRLDCMPPDAIDYNSELEDLLNRDQDPTWRRDALKRFKRRELLRIAGRDLMEKDTLRSSTEQLSQLAGVVTDTALRIARGELERDGQPTPGPFVVIGMGKLGGCELNYSSDIDLIYVYDSETDDAGVHERFQKLGRRLTAVLSEHTDEGYLYRVDLRLRPMGKRGNITYSLRQSAQYYETWGETFERFALIKARPIAGDMELGQRFLEMVQPFVYRKYLDHAAIEELARYKARSDSAAIRRQTMERDVKIGRGGIREIELFTQVFQLIYGGRHEALQQSNTLTALSEIHRQGLIDQEVLTDLTGAYEFLRTVEHRLQVVQESQTHTLADTDLELGLTARRLGFSTADELQQALDTHRDGVHGVYLNLFERRREEDTFQGRQLFRLLSGELSDEEARAHLGGYGLPDPGAALRAVQALEEAPSLARSKTATRNLLANLLATALGEIAVCGSPGNVLNRLEQVVVRAGAPASLYQSLLENDDLRKRLLQALDTGALFADRLARYPELLDSLITVSLDAEAFRAAVATGLKEIDPEGHRPLSECMDPFRRFKAIEEFKVLVEWLSGGSLETLNGKLSMTAEAALGWIAVRAAEERLGNQASGDDRQRWVVAALGKLGGRELTVHSDLDLVFLYDGTPEDSKQFEQQQAFVRAIHDFVERPTGAGVAYRIDTRLRPEGKKGALAIPIVAFKRYLGTRAEIWERMAWTRCRFIAGQPALVADLESSVQEFVFGAWDLGIPAYARHLRTRMEHELAKETPRRFDLKTGKGGLADIDFLLQALQLRAGADDDAFRVRGTRAALSTLPDNPYVPRALLGRLRTAYEFLRRLETVLRIETDSSVGWIALDDVDTVERIAQHLGLEPATGEGLIERYREVTTDVREIYEAGMTALES